MPVPQEQFDESRFLEGIDAARAQLGALQDALESAHRLALAGQLAAGLAHELNNLLTPAVAYLHLAESRPDDDALQRKAVGTATRSLDDASRIIRTMLDFAAPHAAEYADALVIDVVERARTTADAYDAHRRVDVHVDVPDALRVAMQPIALQQVMVNLMLNASAAMAGRSGAELFIDASRDGSGGAVIDVRDTGPGVPEEVAATLFEPFVTTHAGGDVEATGAAGGADPTGSDRVPGGSGLGLMVCRQLVEKAGGSIDLMPGAPGDGAHFRLWLPVRVDAEATNHAA